MHDNYLGTIVPTRNGATLTAIRVHHIKNSRKYYSWHCSSCSGDTELWPEGSIISCKYDVLKYSPCGCGKVGKYSERQMLIRASRYARKINSHFLGWARSYTGNTTKCLLLCEQHGTWETCGFNDLMRGRGCPSCAKISRSRNKRLPLDYCEVRATLGLACRNLEYVGLAEKFKGGHTRIIINCADHGQFESTFHYANQGNTGCMKCAISGYGFDQGKEAVLYALRSDCGSYTKIGVSTNFERRKTQLRANTPFDFTVFGTWSSTGTEVLRLERWFHANFESAGLSGFEGHSEWIKHNPEALERFNHLAQGSFPTSLLPER